MDKIKSFLSVRRNQLFILLGVSFVVLLLVIFVIYISNKSTNNTSKIYLASETSSQNSQETISSQEQINSSSSSENIINNSRSAGSYTSISTSSANSSQKIKNSVISINTKAYENLGGSIGTVYLSRTFLNKYFNKKTTLELNNLLVSKVEATEIAPEILATVYLSNNTKSVKLNLINDSTLTNEYIDEYQGDLTLYEGTKRIYGVQFLPKVEKLIIDDVDGIFSYNMTNKTKKIITTYNVGYVKPILSPSEQYLLYTDFLAYPDKNTLHIYDLTNEREHYSLNIENMGHTFNWSNNDNFVFYYKNTWDSQKGEPIYGGIGRIDINSAENITIIPNTENRKFTPGVFGPKLLSDSNVMIFNLDTGATIYDFKTKTYHELKSVSLVKQMIEIPNTSEIILQVVESSQDLQNNRTLNKDIFFKVNYKTYTVERLQSNVTWDSTRKGQLEDIPVSAFCKMIGFNGNFNNMLIAHTTYAGEDTYLFISNYNFESKDFDLNYKMIHNVSDFNE
ncbi:MAG: hypothetical protein WCK31_01865 [bacterium]